MIAAVWGVLRPAVDISPLCDDRWVGSGRRQASTERLEPSMPGLLIIDGMLDAIDGMVDGIDGMGQYHRWHGGMPSMAWLMTSMAWGDAIDGMVDGIDGMG